MKYLIFSLLIPFQAFCCTKCIDILHEKIDEQSVQIIRLENSYLISDELMIYMYGRLDALYDVLYVIEMETGCP